MRSIPTSAALALFLPATPALADAIDGHWCAEDGRNFTIDGPRIVTPAGLSTFGEYSRHAFAYDPPAGDPEHGVTITLILLNEDELRRSTLEGLSVAGREIWRRSNATS